MSSNQPDASASTRADAARANLHQGLRLRPTVQAVAANILKLDLGNAISEDLKASIKDMARYSYDMGMPSTFSAHPGLERAASSAFAFISEIASKAGLDEVEPPNAQDPKSLAEWLEGAFATLGLDPLSTRPATKTPKRPGEGHYRFTYLNPDIKGARGEKGGHPDARTGMSAALRKELLPGVSVRLYRHGVRTVNHLAQRTAVFAEERAREENIAYAKSRLASAITFEEFSTSDLSSAFVAYYTARLNARTAFSIDPQERPMDTIAEALLKAALGSGDANFGMIAKVITRPSVLKNLSTQEKVDLLGGTFDAMVSAARLLDAKADLKRHNMVVRAGDDSSSWNAASRAFNQARTGWLNIISALDLKDTTDLICPGKVSALIAGDVSYWHASSGSEVHADEAISKLLPPPWQVVLGQATCTSLMVRNACASVGVDPDATGWTAAYFQSEIEEATPTPARVHGVAVEDPILVKALRDGGFFSGYAKKTP